MNIGEYKYLITLADDLCVLPYIKDKLDITKDYEQQRNDIVMKEYEKRYCNEK